ncbi:MAG: proteasome accessory factor PafA2 family protein, partial [Acidimicrobiales bacterium]
RAMHAVSQDLTLRRALRMADGSTATALDVQWHLYELARKYAMDHGTASVGGADVGTLILDRWGGVLEALEADPMSLAGQLDWVAKLHLLEGYRARHDLAWQDRRLAAMDLQYHDLRPARSLFSRLGTERLVSDEEVARAVETPPRGTRAWFRGACLARWPDAVVTANWDSLVFDLGQDPLRRVPMMDPLRGTADHVEELLQKSSTPADLLSRLSQ